MPVRFRMVKFIAYSFFAEKTRYIMKRKRR
nr:MAG TPA: hypothetical protein [Caudoviricetes sp.]